MMTDATTTKEIIMATAVPAPLDPRFERKKKNILSHKERYTWNKRRISCISLTLSDICFICSNGS